MTEVISHQSLHNSTHIITQRKPFLAVKDCFSENVSITCQNNSYINDPAVLKQV